MRVTCRRENKGKELEKNRLITISISSFRPDIHGNVRKTETHYLRFRIRNFAAPKPGKAIFISGIQR
jgi:hypothetical protein